MGAMEIPGLVAICAAHPAQIKIDDDIKALKHPIYFVLSEHDDEITESKAMAIKAVVDKRASEGEKFLYKRY